MRKLLYVLPILCAVIGCDGKKAETPKEFAPMPKQGPSDMGPSTSAPSVNAK
ncbi:MAG TPA: hypothetical protein VHR66_14120 [Gemmataceae bacterium]|jgi:hypothetical protein|nr:hypothetical protein [Gemmataceae bacterium]